MSDELVEIERKYLVVGDFHHLVTKSYRIRQGYLNADPERTVRLRLMEDRAFMTVKGKSFDGGLSRFEWEKEIEVQEAESLLKLCEAYPVDKVRHVVLYENQKFEVDVFYGLNEGLVLAEIELLAPDQQVVLPDWIGEEVTGDARYYNASISVKPFSMW